MHPKISYLTVTISRNNSGEWYIAKINGRVGDIGVGHSWFDRMKELGEIGWDLVTSYMEDAGRTNLVFKRVEPID